jgi:hypothetical protein
MLDDGMLFVFLSFETSARPGLKGLCRIAAQQMLRTMIPRFPLAKYEF